MSEPTPGEWMESESGEYMVQPKSAAPPGVKKPDSIKMPPTAVSQKPNAFSRGKATSGAPICNGMT